MEGADSNVYTLILIHRTIGYITAFVIVPTALLLFSNPKSHRAWGKCYFYSMVFLYLTGTYFTLTQHDWNSWGFARNVTFNFFGFSLAIYGYRAIRLFRFEGSVSPSPLDRSLAWLLTISVGAMFLVAAYKNTPMKIFTLVGIFICVLEWREVAKKNWEKPLLFKRHLRFILASYFYVLTVVSIVHLKDELPNNARWLWATVTGAVLIWILTAAKNQGYLPGVSQGAITRRAVYSLAALSIIFGIYILFDLLFGSSIISQS